MSAIEVSASAKAAARKIINKFIHAGRSRVLFEKKFQAVCQRLQQSVRAHAVRPPPRLNVRHDFPFEPRQIRIRGQNDEQQQRDLDERDKQLRVRV